MAALSLSSADQQGESEQDEGVDEQMENQRGAEGDEDAAGGDEVDALQGFDGSEDDQDVGIEGQVSIGSI